MGVNRVTGSTRYLVFHVAACKASDMRRLVQMAAQAHFVGRGRRHFPGISNIGGRSRFDVGLAGTVAGFAGSSLESVPFPGLHALMRAFLKSVINIAVTSLAHLGAGVSARKRGLRRCAPGREKQDRYPPTRISIAHGLGRPHTRRPSCDKPGTLRRATRCSKACETPPEYPRGIPNRPRKSGRSD